MKREERSRSGIERKALCFGGLCGLKTRWRDRRKDEKRSGKKRENEGGSDRRRKARGAGSGEAQGRYCNPYGTPTAGTGRDRRGRAHARRNVRSV